ncbi:MAG TPA: DNA translocase FtsK [Leptospiraceae bacterium]|nr:DNA translocase FtsK [Leptospiraceae bacterium]HMX35537.1 DNA translocase FtsK [Leptospiraceae bacterium]HMY34047.1 DNA translocase FtsK [Leptospiraceae bacterium]HMZ65714.1 DNA translocase FtsK [Leptospiraceae bacterium]HNA10336.1 DNA translocase FtsK [Leptospiraceae bacterium]
MSGIKPPSTKKKMDLSPRTRAFSPYGFLFFSIFCFFSMLSFQDVDAQQSANLFGRLGHYFAYLTFYLFGRASYILGVLGFIFGIISFQKKEPDVGNLLLSVPIILLACSIFCSIFEVNITSLKDGGGYIGLKFSTALEYIFGQSGRIILNVVIFLYGALIIVRESPREINKDYLLNLWKETISKYPIREKLESYIHQVRKKEEEETEEELTGKIPWFEIRRREQSYVDELETPISTVEEEITEESPVFNQTSAPKGFKTTNSEIIDKFEYKSVISELKPKTTQAIYKEEIKIDPIPKFKSTPSQIISKINQPSLPNEQITASNLQSYISSTSEKKAVDPEDFEEEIMEAELVEADEMLDSSLPGLMTDEDEVLADDLQDMPTEEVDLFGNKIENKPAQKPVRKQSTVPDIIPKRNTDYYLSSRILARKTEKKSDPLFKLEAEKIGLHIQEIIKQYGYDSKVVSYQRGPIITRYELTPPQGVKLGRITSLTDELKLNLAVKSIRMVAPIPGKNTIGIEVPNKYRDDVYLGDILKDTSALQTQRDLNIVIGKDSITGENVSIDLNKLPHLLVAGTTGSGKSVSMNSMICSLIFNKSPDDVRFVMIDPKMVELALYEDIPHLLMPVITDPRKATKALAWAVQEMEIRYNLVSELKCRDLKTYNEKVATSLKFSRGRYKHLPYIVIFIDELSDLMMVSGKELEDYITRISQKSRAVGIHLVMATQRPSVDVITGLIKANCPARMAFHVAQKTDSKIILDYNGADALLGKGDFLYKSPTSPDLQRIQAPFISEDEIEQIVEEVRKHADPEYVDINLDEESFQEESSEEDEESFEEAWMIVKTDRKASASYLQRRLRIGYNKAARLMEMMEERGYVGPQIGSKPREILR